MYEATLTREDREIQLYIVVAAGWNSVEIRRDTDMYGGMTITEWSGISRADAREELPRQVAKWERRGWTLKASKTEGTQMTSNLAGTPEYDKARDAARELETSGLFAVQDFMSASGITDSVFPAFCAVTDEIAARPDAYRD